MLPASTLVERVVGIMGNATRRNLLEVEVETTIATIRGYVGRPETARNNSSEQYMFVNGRFFRSPYLNKAVSKAYEKLIPEKAYPSYFLYLTVDTERVDVNVHAQKTEVKFADNEAIWQIVNAAVRETLAKTGAVPLIDFDNEEPVEIPVAPTLRTTYSEPRATTRDYYNPFDETTTEPAISRGGSSNSGAIFEDISSVELGVGEFEESEFEYFESSDAVEQSLELELEREQPRNITLMGGRYAVATFASKILIFDLVRARERMLYNGYCVLLKGGAAVTQQLLFPEELILTEEEYDLVEEYALDFALLGFDLKLKQGTTIEVLGTPADVAPEAIDRAIYDLIQCLKLPQSVVALRRDAMAQALAHSDSVRRVNFVQEEAERIVNSMLAMEMTRTPAGKDIVVAISADDIKNRLG
jgi:DNA mismatch repair protein MutL